jgi:hypothetical protein
VPHLWITTRSAVDCVDMTAPVPANWADTKAKR